MGIGVPIICIKKYSFRKKVGQIPKPILPKQCFEMKTFQNKSHQEPTTAHLSTLDTESVNISKSSEDITTTSSIVDIFEYVGQPQQNAAKMTFNTKLRQFQLKLL